MVKPSGNGDRYEQRRSVGQSALRLVWAFVLCQAVAANPALADAPTTVTLHDVVVAPEDQRVMNFPIERGGDLGHDLLLRYHTTDVSAQAGADYTGAAGTLLLPAGTASASIPVSLNAGMQNFDDRSLRLWLDSAAAVGPAPTFAAGQHFFAGSNLASLALADVNGDGRPDIIATSADLGPGQSVVNVYLNTTSHGATTASFAAPVAVAQNSTSVFVLVDVNGDGRPDLIKVDSDSSGFTRTISVLMNNTPIGSSTPAFGSPQKFSFPTRNIAFLSSIVAIDVNSDGRLDLAVCESYMHTVQLFVNTTSAGAGSATFAAAQSFDAYIGGGIDLSAVAVDLNQDGKQDLVLTATSNGIGEPLAVLLNATAQGAGTVTFLPPHFVPGAAQSIVVQDINGDSRPDLVLGNRQDFTILFNTTPQGEANVTFDSEQTVSPGYGAASLASADFNGDGKPDLAVSSNGGTSVVLYDATAKGGLTPDFLASPDPNNEPLDAGDIGDVNGDGKPDIVLLDGDGVTVRLNTSGAIDIVTDAAIVGSPALGVIQGERIFLDGFE